MCLVSLFSRYNRPIFMFGWRHGFILIVTLFLKASSRVFLEFTLYKSLCEELFE
jgi:hypothetical protein